MFSFPSFRLSTLGISGALLATSLTVTAPARAFNQNDVDHIIYGDGNCFRCDISGADINSQRITVEYFEALNAVGTQFGYTQWVNTPNYIGNVVDSDFTGANFSEASLESVHFTNSLFIGANFSGSEQFSVSYFGSNFTRANFSGASLFDVIFENSVAAPRSPFLSSPLGPTGTGTNLTDTDFTNAVIDGTSFINADFTGSVLNGARFQNVNLFGSNITPAQLNSLASFSGTLPDGTVVPEPSVILGLLAIGGLGFTLRRQPK